MKPVAPETSMSGMRFLPSDWWPELLVPTEFVRETLCTILREFSPKIANVTEPPWYRSDRETTGIAETLEFFPRYRC